MTMDQVAATLPKISHADLQTSNLLRALSSQDAELICPIAQAWQGELGATLFEPGETIRYVYFPCGPSMISYLVALDDGRLIETALIGREGAAGGIVSQGRLPAYAKAEVQFPGPFRASRSKNLRKPSRSPLPYGTCSPDMPTASLRRSSRQLRATPLTRSSSAPRSGSSQRLNAPVRRSCR